MSRENQALNLVATDLERIVRKFEAIKSPKNAQEDKTAFSNILKEARESFDRFWTSRKLLQTREAKFRIFLSEVETFSGDLDRVSDSLKIRTSPEETSASVNAAMKFVEQLEATKIKVNICLKGVS